MCGIIGVIGTEAAAPKIIEALRRLEYRGYDSAGIATIDGDRLDRRRAEGKLGNLQLKLLQSPLSGAIGIGHTRWATHGRPTERNAHPHATDRLAVVHNGIIENFRELKAELERKGVAFETETDTEVVAQLVSSEIACGQSPQDAVRLTLPRLRGAFALVFLFAGHADLLIGVRQGAPLVVGFSERETYLGSDAIGLAPFAKEITYLHDGDWVIATRSDVELLDHAGIAVHRLREPIIDDIRMVDKGHHRHFMSKEIHEQPEAAVRTLSHYVDFARSRVRLPPAPFDFRTASRLSIAACGSAYYAALVSRYWFETLAHLPVDIDVASEARYRDRPRVPGELTLVVSQSGETADTLAALRSARSDRQPAVAVVNVPSSTMAREADFVFPTLAGTEIGVASTKAFDAQLIALLCVAIAAGRARQVLTENDERELVTALLRVSGLIAEALRIEPAAESVARLLAKASSVMYLGRGTAYPLALEGALKLKEITYIHAEGFAAGELKHGPISLIDEATPIVVVAPAGALVEKTISNMEEAAARGAQVVLVTDTVTAAQVPGTVATLALPPMDNVIAPIVYAVPLQLLAYKTAALMGKDIDQPRNLAKSVTVE